MTHSRILTIAVLVLGLAAAIPTAQAGKIASTEVVGKFGFDWLNPAKAKCAAVTAEAAAKFASCAYQAAGETGSFTGTADFYQCKAGAKSEFMIYKTQARCAEELATMQANGE